MFLDPVKIKIFRVHVDLGFDCLDIGNIFGAILDFQRQIAGGLGRAVVSREENARFRLWTSGNFPCSGTFGFPGRRWGVEIEIRYFDQVT